MSEEFKLEGVAVVKDYEVVSVTTKENNEIHALVVYLEATHQEPEDWHDVDDSITRHHQVRILPLVETVSQMKRRYAAKQTIPPSNLNNSLCSCCLRYSLISCAIRSD